MIKTVNGAIGEKKEAKRKLDSQSPWIDVFYVSGIIAVFGVWPAFKWMKLFPLVEFRSKIYFDLSFNWLWRNWTFRGNNIWSSSFYFDSGVGRACGSNIVCLNSLPLLVNLFSVLALYAASMVFFRRRIIAASCSIFWLLSVPYLETLAWQALSLDKIAAFTTIVGSLIGFKYYKSEYTYSKMMTANVLLLLLVVVGYNAKPSAWVLVPGLWLIPIIGEGIRVAKWTQYLILPTIYGLINNFYVYKKVQADTYYKEHTSGGSPKLNLDKFVSYLFGGRAPNNVSKAIFFLVVLLILVGILTRIRIARLGLWSLLIVLGGFAISARTIYGSAFYMLVSQAFFIWSISAAILVVSALANRIEISKFQIEAVLFIVISLLFVQKARETNKYYEVGIQQSKNFMGSFERIKIEVARSKQSHLKILIGDSMDYKYVDGAPLGKFISSNFPIPESNISWMHTNDFEYDLAESDTLYVHYNDEMNIGDVFVIPNGLVPQGNDS